MSNQLKPGLLLLAVVASAMLVLASGCRKADSRLLSLTFQRYSDLFESHVGEDVGFFWLTNASNKTFLLCMTGGSNTWLFDTHFIPYKGKPKESYMVNCAFRDQTAQGWTNWVQEPLPTRGQNSFLQLAPHSGVLIRAPLPANGQKRKVAVVCELVPWWQPALVSQKSGPALLRVLPWFVLRRLVEYQPRTIQVWCDQELSYPGGRIAP